MEDKNDYGVYTEVNPITRVEKKLKITGMLQGYYVDNRVISVAGLEDDSIVLLVENPPSTGRSNQQMRLTKESLLGLIQTTFLYLSATGENLHELVEKSAKSSQLEFVYSDNLQPPNLEV